MKKGYKILTSVLIIGILVLTGGSAMAGWTVNAGNTKITTGGGNSSNFVSLGTISSPVYTVVAGEELAQYSTVTLTLTGGATFSSAATTLTATCSAGGVLTLLNSATVPGATTATFRVTTPGGILTNEGITFHTVTASCAAINVSAVTSGASVDFLATLTTPANTNLVTNASLYTAKSSYPFTAQSIMAPTFVLQTATADVKATSGPYTKFENDTVKGGKTDYTLDLNISDLTTNAKPGVELAKYKALITLTGDFTGISKVTCNSSYIGSDITGLTTGGVAGQFLINAAKTAAYVTNNVVLSGSTSELISPEFYIDGTTVQAERSFQAKVETFADGSNYVASTWLGPVKSFTIARNGVFFTSNSIGQYNTIKISDKSGAVPTGGAKVMITAYDAAGTKLAEAAGNADILLQNNQTIELTGTQLAARFVGTAMKYEVAVASTSAAITNVKKTPEGFGSNVWTINGGTL